MYKHLYHMALNLDVAFLLSVSININRYIAKKPTAVCRWVSSMYSPAL